MNENPSGDGPRGHGGGPGDGADPGLRAAVAVVGCGVIAAWLLPGSSPGLGVLLVAAAVGATFALAVRRSVSGETLVYGVLALALSITAVVRAAEWVVATNLLAAGGLGCLAAFGGTSWAEVFGAPLRMAAGALRAPALVLAPVAAGLGSVGGRARPALRGMGIGLVLLAVFGPLFASADRAFAQITTEILTPDWDLSLVPVRVAVFGVAVAAVGALVLTRPRSAGAGHSRAEPTRKLSPAEWVVAVGMLDALFVGFVGVQIAVLFGGRDHVLRTTGLTYAQYARSGFFQLLVIGFLTLAVVAAAGWWADTRRAGARRLLQALLGVLCGSALVVLASAVRRLVLYEETYGLTRDRLAPHAVILWLGVIFVLVIVAGVTMRGEWLPRAAVVTTALSLLVFTAINPDDLITRRNVERYEATGRLDVGELSSLSADAVPALLELPPALRACALAGLQARLAEPEPWHSFNASRERARDLLGDTDRVAPCPEWIDG